MRYRPTTTGHKHQLAAKNGRSGGKASAAARALPGSSTYGGQTMLEEQAQKMNQSQLALYGQIFANRVQRNPRGPRPGTKFRPRKARKLEEQLS